MTADSTSESGGGRNTPSLLGRLLFAAGVGTLAADTFRNLDGQVAYAESKGVPNAETMVPFAGGMLAFGSLGVALWRLPTLAAGAVATFLAGVTPMMHDYWNADEENRDSERIAFLKNVSLLGAALVFLRRARRTD
jgi:uncharacterized membrane protein YphA (DoxX/SURF4 family)